MSSDCCTATAIDGIDRGILGGETESTRRYRRDSPEKVRAQDALNNAIKAGKIARRACEVCGDPESQGHHPDYSKSLDVRWLCRLCHARLHQELRKTLEHIATP